MILTIAVHYARRQLGETVTLSVNGAPLTLGSDLRFSQAVTLVEGVNTSPFKVEKIT